jgi:hypothetical protein
VSLLCTALCQVHIRYSLSQRYLSRSPGLSMARWATLPLDTRGSCDPHFDWSLQRLFKCYGPAIGLHCPYSRYKYMRTCPILPLEKSITKLKSSLDNTKLIRAPIVLQGLEWSFRTKTARDFPIVWSTLCLQSSPLLSVTMLPIMRGGRVPGGRSSKFDEQECAVDHSQATIPA